MDSFRVPLSPKKGALAKHNVQQTAPTSPSKHALSSRSASPKKPKAQVFIDSPAVKLSYDQPAVSSIHGSSPRLGSSPLKRPHTHAFLSTPTYQSPGTLLMREGRTSPRKRPTPLASLTERSRLSVSPTTITSHSLLSPPAAPPISPSPLKQGTPTATDAERSVLRTMMDSAITPTEQATLPMHPYKQGQGNNTLVALLTPPRPCLPFASSTTRPDSVQSAPGRLASRRQVTTGHLTVLRDPTSYEAIVDQTFEQGVDVNKENEGHRRPLHRYKLRSVDPVIGQSNSISI
ncbi:hypothetical protein BCR37DRAFT_153585 [Protomyces lactucae-debilis]|uniref:Uncharacterized protein n=1 Tax=Protomyces lactucae-debilis TaxID=2754530 RepID=A0A1Y2F323_PROLT|nr:uncharacterized protein BCR37DRAFT_153585 [Protomyces lactucae-debilis]ORY77365.1 hypothetical protein BCR37DRAFT_153585 [Protomyces lactucae-debilis]